ncbi:MAG: RNA polymerase sigma factor [Candidatus Margulisbacteria bacterium]|jgi:RNA polymerase sigma-70 factor (ECF subfamily)|nr:RNA polymerase sigma factor [Candidatus Margulisiibacteriota bacterium]
MPKIESCLPGFIAGDEAAFKTLYLETSGLLYRVVFHMTGVREEAEDILHDVYVRAYEKRKSYRPELSSLRTWLYRIAVNQTLNQLKRRRWLDGNLGRLFGRPAEPDVLDAYLETEEGQSVQRLLRRLPENFRICLVLRDIEEKSYAEIAAVLNIEPGTVKSRIARGRKLLKTMYDREGRRK